MHPALAIDAAGNTQFTWAAETETGALEVHWSVLAADHPGMLPEPVLVSADDGYDSLRPVLNRGANGGVDLVFQDRRSSLEQV